MGPAVQARTSVAATRGGAPVRLSVVTVILTGRRVEATVQAVVLVIGSGRKEQGVDGLVGVAVAEREAPRPSIASVFRWRP